jgi:glycosidase
VTFLGNHDVKRFSSVPGSTPEKLRLAFSLLLTMRGIPQLYAADDFGMPGEDDPDNRRDFPGGFPGDPRNAFTPEGRTPEEQQTFSHLQSLLRLRREHAALRSGQQRHLFVDDTAYVFLRESKDETLLVAFNNSEMPRRLTVELADTPIQNAQQLDPLFSARSAVIESGRVQIEIPGRTLAIYGVR